MNAETQPERRSPLHLVEKKPEATPEVPRNLEPFAEAQGWLSFARKQLSRPEAAVWEEGRHHRQDKTYQRVSPSERYIGYDDPTTHRSFIISDSPVPGGKLRAVEFLIADMPTADSKDKITSMEQLKTATPQQLQTIMLKREQAVKLIYDETEQLVAVQAADTKNWYQDGTRGRFESDWYHGGSAKNSRIDTNSCTKQEVLDMMATAVPQLARAQVNKEFGENIKQQAQWSDKLGQSFFALQAAEASGDKRQIVEGRRKLAALQAQYRKEYGMPSLEEWREVNESILEHSQQEAGQASLIPQHMRKDEYFNEIYQEIEAEMTGNGKKKVARETIEKRVVEVFAERKEERIKRVLKDAA